MPPKSAMERLTLDDDPTEANKAPIKATLSATFEGTHDQFHTWLHETFKNPEFLQLRVQIGPSIVGQVPIPVVNTTTLVVPRLSSSKTLTAAIRQIRGLANNIGSDESAQILIERSLAEYSRGGIVPAVKQLRAETGIDLGPIKTFVEKHFPTLAVRPAD